MGGAWCALTALTGLVAAHFWRHDRTIRRLVWITTAASAGQHVGEMLLSETTEARWHLLACDRACALALTGALLVRLHAVPHAPHLAGSLLLCALCDLGYATGRGYVWVHSAWHVSVWVYVARAASGRPG